MRRGFTNQRCPRCGGNTYIDLDYYLEGDIISWYEQECCLQCGHKIYDPQSFPLATRVTTRIDITISAEKEPVLV